MTDWTRRLLVVLTLATHALAAVAQEASQPGSQDQGRQGEPAGQAPGRVVVTEEEAERALERALVQAGGLLLPAGRIEIEPSLRYARRENAYPTFFTRGGGTFLGQTRRNADQLTADLALRIGLPADSQFELRLPYHWRRVERVEEIGGSPVAASSATGSGSGNVGIGIAKTLLREAPGRPDVIGRLGWTSRSGTARDGGVAIARDQEAATLSLTAIKRQDPLVFLGGFSYEHVFEHDDVQPGSAISPTFGAFLALSPRTSLRMAFSQTFREETRSDGAPVPGSDTTAAALTLGGSTLLTQGVLLNLSVDMGLTDDADDFAFRLALPIRF